MGACHCGSQRRRSGSSGDIRDHYKIGGILGSGSFGQVRACTSKGTSEIFAVKIMAKDPPKQKRGRNNVDFGAMFRNEVSLLSQLNHRNIIRLHGFYEDRHHFYAIMEKCDGGELFTHIVKNRRFDEADASMFCYDMLKAVQYIHSCNVVHRDIKAENFLFYEQPRTGRLVLIDFGMSIRLTDDRMLKQLCGSPHYVAPELIRRSYRFKVDMWALGVVVFLMLYGKYPFEGADQKAIVQAILNAQPEYNRSPRPPSRLAIDFMRSLLEKNPDRRLGPNEALNHPWIQKYVRQYSGEARGELELDDFALSGRRNTQEKKVVQETHHKETVHQTLGCGPGTRRIGQPFVHRFQVNSVTRVMEKTAASEENRYSQPVSPADASANESSTGHLVEVLSDVPGGSVVDATSVPLLRDGSEIVPNGRFVGTGCNEDPYDSEVVNNGDNPYHDVSNDGSYAASFEGAYEDAPLETGYVSPRTDGNGDAYEDQVLYTDDEDIDHYAAGAVQQCQEAMTYTDCDPGRSQHEEDLKDYSGTNNSAGCVSSIKSHDKAAPARVAHYKVKRYYRGDRRPDRSGTGTSHPFVKNLSFFDHHITDHGTD